MTHMLDTNVCIAAMRGNPTSVVTHNLHEFRRVPGLKVEDWEL